MDHICNVTLKDDLTELMSLRHEKDIDLILELPEGEPYPAKGSYGDQVLLENIITLQHEGVFIAIDDYGKGVNVGEEVIDRLMPDILKIDKNVVQNPTENEKVWSSLKSIIRRHTLRVVAEGIESQDDLEVVIKAGIRFAKAFVWTTC